MDYQEYLDQLETDRTIFATLGHAELDARVAGCPTWDLGDLFGHLGGIHRWATTSVTSKSLELTRPSSQAPAGHQRVDWLVEGLDQLITTLRNTDPLKPCPTWAGPADAAWWARRQAHETVIHRWDAQSALGPCDPIPAATAVDGIQEWLELFGPRYKSPETEPECTIHLHATDRSDDGEWTVTVGESVTWRAEHAKGDLAIRGSASDLILVLWNRIPLVRTETFGDTDLMGRLRPA